MIVRLRNFFAELERRRGNRVPAPIDRSHYWNASDPIEARLARALSQFPKDELDFLIMNFGLDGQYPREPHVVADALGMVLLRVLDTGAAAKVRLRNRTETRELIEAIAGDLPERGEDDGPQIVQRDDGSWLAEGTVPTDEVETITGIDMGENVEMLAGFVLAHLGRIPKAGASFIHGNARFEVVDMDGNRIDKVLIEVGPSEK